MVSDQGEKCFLPYFLDLMIKIGKDGTTVKIKRAAKSGGGKMTKETGNQREKRMDKLLRLNYKQTKFGGWGGRGVY